MDRLQPPDAIRALVPAMLLIPLIIGLNPNLPSQLVTPMTASAAIGVSAGQIT